MRRRFGRWWRLRGSREEDAGWVEESPVPAHASAVDVHVLGASLRPRDDVVLAVERQRRRSLDVIRMGPDLNPVRVEYLNG